MACIRITSAEKRESLLLNNSVAKQEVFSCWKNRRYLESAFGCSVVEELERKVQCMDEKELLVAN